MMSLLYDPMQFNNLPGCATNDVRAPCWVSGHYLELLAQVAGVRFPANTIEESEELISGDRNLFLDVVRIPQ